VGALLLLAACGQQADIVAGAAMKKKTKYTADDKELYKLSIKLLDLVYAGREAVRPEVEPTAADIDIIGGKLTPKGGADCRKWVRSYKRQQILVARDNDNINDALTIAGSDKLWLRVIRTAPGPKARRSR
jgi:hypothetical protein